MRRKLYGFILLCGVLLGLSGCGGATKESILTAVAENLDAAQSVEMTMHVPVSGSLRMMGMSLDMSIEANVDLYSTVSDEEEISYMRIDMSVAAMGEQDQESLDIYQQITPEATRVYSEVDGEWICQEVEMDDTSSEQLNAGLTDIISKDPELWILYDKTVTKNDRECYVLLSTLTKEYWEEVWETAESNEVWDALAEDEEMAGMLQAMQDSLSKSHISLTLYVDKQELLPVSMEIDMSSAFNRMMNAILDYVLQSVGEDLWTDMDLESDFRCRITGDASYNTGITVGIPEEALAAEVITLDEFTEILESPQIEGSEGEDLYMDDDA